MYLLSQVFHFLLRHSPFILQVRRYKLIVLTELLKMLILLLKVITLLNNLLDVPFNPALHLLVLLRLLPLLVELELEKLDLLIDYLLLPQHFLVFGLLA